MTKKGQTSSAFEILLTLCIIHLFFRISITVMQFGEIVVKDCLINFKSYKTGLPEWLLFQIIIGNRLSCWMSLCGIIRANV